MNAYQITYRYANKEGFVRTGQAITEAIDPDAAKEAFIAANKGNLRYLQVTNVRSLVLSYTEDRQDANLELPLTRGKAKK